MIRNKMAVVMAADPMGGIGFNGELPWRLKGDLERFRNITDGSVVIMGRKTFESLPNGLPNRTMVVVSSSLKIENHPDIFTVNSYEKAVMVAESLTPDGKLYFVIGGATFFERSLKEANYLFYTVVHLPAEYDTEIKEFDLTGWVLDSNSGEVVWLDEECKTPSHTYLIYKRRQQILGPFKRPYPFRYAR